MWRLQYIIVRILIHSIIVRIHSMMESKRFFVRGSFDSDEFDSNHLVTELIRVNLRFCGENIVYSKQKYGW